MQDQINCGVYVELQRYGDEIQKELIKKLLRKYLVSAEKK
jgi:hypothetical protein